MRSFRKPVGALLLMIAVVAVAGVARGDAERPPVALGDWRELRSPNLRLITDLEPERAGELLRMLEALRTSMTGELLGRPATLRLPTTLVAFAEEASYAAFRVAAREGQFYSTPFESLIVLNGGAVSRPLKMAAAHEYTHALLTEMGVRLPLWLHEGLAEYYSTFLLSDGRVAVGRSVPGHRARLRNRAFVPFEELIAVDGRSSGYHGPEGARFYAQSWLTVHYLLSDVGRGLELGALVGAVQRTDGASGDLALLSGLSAAELDRELRLYLNRDSVPVMVFPAVGAGSLSLETRLLSEGESAYHLGIVALEQARWDPERRPFARDLLEAAVALDPTRGDSHAALASVEALAGRPRLAAEAFERAVFLDAIEGRSYAYYAHYLVESAPPGSSSGTAEVRRASEMLNRALELEPRHRRIARRLEQLTAAGNEGSGPIVAQPPTPPI